MEAAEAFELLTILSVSDHRTILRMQSIAHNGRDPKEPQNIAIQKSTARFARFYYFPQALPSV